MPRRNEFETEYMNDAEMIISGISFSETTESKASYDKKINLLRIYNELLEERHKRIKFALDYGMLDEELKSFGANTEQEKKLEEKLLPFAQILPKEKLELFLQSYEKENKIK